MGGARPKAVVEDDDALWVAKFNRADDKWNTARVEHAMLSLARACGLELRDISGIGFNPFTRSARLISDPSVNYLAHFELAT